MTDSEESRLATQRSDFYKYRRTLSAAQQFLDFGELLSQVPQEVGSALARFTLMPGHAERDLPKKLPRERWGTVSEHLQRLSKRENARKIVERQLDSSYSCSDEAKGSLRRLAYFLEAGEVDVETVVEHVRAGLEGSEPRNVRVVREQLERAEGVEHKHQTMPTLLGSEVMVIHARLVRAGFITATKGWHDTKRQSVLQWASRVTEAADWIAVGGYYWINKNGLDTGKPLGQMLSKGQLEHAHADLTVLLDKALTDAIGERQRRAENDNRSKEIADSEADLKAFEKLHGLRAVSSSSADQKQFARQLRVRAILGGGDTEAWKDLRSARKLIDELKFRDD